MLSLLSALSTHHSVHSSARLTRDPLQGHDGREQPERAVVGVKERGALAVVAQITRVLNHSEPHLPVVELPDHRTFASHARASAAPWRAIHRSFFRTRIIWNMPRICRIYIYISENSLGNTQNSPTLTLVSLSPLSWVAISQS